MPVTSNTERVHPFQVLLGADAIGLRSLRPQPAQRHRRKALAEAEGSFAGVQHDSRGEAGSEPLAQVAESREVLGLDARAQHSA